MVRLRETIAQLAQADIDVLIEGETGTGKELVAHMLQRQSRRSGGALVAVNCAALQHEVAEGELFGRDPAIGRAAGWGRGGEYVYGLVVGVAIKKKKTNKINRMNK